jgi:release factor glutamine methyltransferase
VIAAPSTVDSVLRHHAALFRQAGLDCAELDARLLLAEAMQHPGLSLGLHGELPVSAAAMARLEGMGARRLAGEPVDRILGRREFWGLDFILSPDTLVPRPDSETLVEYALDLLGNRRAEPLTLLDLGTGSGCLLIALLHECRNATGIGLDVSHGALKAAQANAIAAGVGDRARWVSGNWGDALRLRADLVVSNPPYITTADIAGLAPEVRLHDPLRALDGGPDGLDAYYALATALPRMLKPGAYAVLELGSGQLGDVAALMTGAGLSIAGSRQDLAGHERVLAARAVCE